MSDPAYHKEKLRESRMSRAMYQVKSEEQPYYEGSSRVRYTLAIHGYRNIAQEGGGRRPLGAPRRFEIHMLTIRQGYRLSSGVCVPSRSPSRSIGVSVRAMLGACVTHMGRRSAAKCAKFSFSPARVGFL